jgi:uncharacterized membrane protein
MKNLLNNKIGKSLPALLLLSFCCLLLLTGRVFLTGKITYVFLSWNLFLAWLPLVFSYQLNQEKPLLLNGMFAVLWLLFFPNAPYLITDLVHLRPRPGFPVWFDIILLSSLAWTGILLAFASLLKIQRYISEKFGDFTAWSAVVFSIAACSFGIYLGRVLRWNSWDVLTDPFPILSDIASTMIHPLSHPKAWGMTIVFSLFLTVSYFSFWAFVNSKDENDRQ